MSWGEVPSLHPGLHPTVEVPAAVRTRVMMAQDVPAWQIVSYHLLSSLLPPELSRLAFSRTSTARFPSTSWAELKFVMTRAGIPRQRSTATTRTPAQPWSTNGTRTPSLTCAGDASKHPALAVFHRPGPGLAPLPEDRNTAGPSTWRNAIREGLGPTTSQHPPVVIGVHLGHR